MNRLHLVGLLAVAVAGPWYPVLADWPMLAHDPARSGSTPTEIRPPFTRKWYRAFPDEGIFSGVQPVVASGRVFIGTQRGILHALDSQTGRELWSFRAGGPILHACAAGTDRVFFGAADGTIYALHAADGSLAWSVPTQAAIWNAPLVHQDLVLIGSRDGHLYACDLATGNLRWKAPTLAPILCSPAIDPRTRRAFVGSEDMCVYAFDLADGRQVWRSQKLPGASLRGYHPVIAPDGSVMITVTPCAGGDAIQAILLDMVKEIFGDFASWRHTKQENDRLRQQNFELMKKPETYQRQLEYLRKRLQDQPACQSFFVLDPQTGRQKFVTPIVYAESMNGPGAPPVVSPDGKVIVKYSALLRSRYEHYSPFLNVGYLDTSTGHIEPIMDQSRTYGWHDSLLLVHDEQCQLAVGGRVLFNTHQDNVNAMDLVTLRGYEQPMCHNVHEVGPGVPNSIWAIHLSGRPLPMGWEWFARGTAVYGGGSVIDTSIVIDGDSFYYLPTHEINAGVVLLAYRMDANGQASHRAAQPTDVLTEQQWQQISTLNWDWDILEMPRLRTVLDKGLPGKIPGTRHMPLTGQARQAVAAIADAQLDSIIWDDEPQEPAPDDPRTEPWKQKLAAAVQELVSTTWQPLLFPAGKHPQEAYRIFADPTEMLYTLALAYPHLPQALKQKVAEHVRNMSRPGGPLASPARSRWFDPAAGQVRSAYDPAPESLLRIQNDLVRSDTARLYPFWLWAQVSGDWSGLERDWPRLRELIRTDPDKDEYDCGNSRLAGLLAACRLARRFNDPAASALLQATRAAIRSRLEYELAHTRGGLITSVAHLRTIFGRWHFLTPDVARLLRTHAAHIHRHLMDVYVDHHRPTWWLAWNVELLYRNECPFSLPSMAADIFAARAMILRERPETLARYVDLPWCKADEYYIQKIALLLSNAAISSP